MRTMFETDRIPASFKPRLIEMDEVWVPAQFNVDTFALVSQDLLAVAVRADDPRCDRDFFADLLSDLEPIAVREVAP